jgi:hypothetical protein
MARSPVLTKQLQYEQEGVLVPQAEANAVTAAVAEAAAVPSRAHY